MPKFFPLWKNSFEWFLGEVKPSFSPSGSWRSAFVLKGAEKEGRPLKGSERSRFQIAGPLSAAESLCSGKKKQHKHKLFGPDFPRTFLTLTPGRPWVKKFLPITGAAEKRTFWCGRPRFLARTSMTRRVFEKLCTKKVCADFLGPKKGSLGRGRSGTSAQSFVLCVFLCSEVIFSCKSHRNFFQKLPLQCRHFLENPLAKNPKTQLLIENLGENHWSRRKLALAISHGRWREKTPNLGSYRKTGRRSLHGVYPSMEASRRSLVLRYVKGLLGTDPPDPHLESASPSPPQGSIWHRFTRLLHQSNVTLS